MLKIQNIKIIVLILSIGLILTANAFAQTTAFTYQGRFTDSTVAQPTNGTYNMQFALFDAVSGGNQVGVTVTVTAVSVVNGIFTVSLDYTAAGFDGTARFLQITVVNTVLSPRQEITSAPYAIRARSATLANDSNKLGGIDADQYITGQVVRSVNNLTNNVTLAAGSNITITPSGNTLTIASTGGGNFIQNSTVQQPTSNFNISGSGTTGGTLSANIVNSTTTYRIGGATVFSTPNSSSVVAGRSANHALLTPNSTFFGYNAGAGTTLFGQSGTFIGSEAGAGNTNGADNSFVGKHAGIFNSTGSSNSFFGSNAGKFNNASENSYFGAESGFLGLGGTRNSFFGFKTGRANLNGDNNSFFGYQAGVATTGDGNTFVGSEAGNENTNGAKNTYLGFQSGFGSGSKNTVVGSETGASGSQNTVIGQNSSVSGSFNTSLGTGFSASGNSNTLIGYFARTDSSQFPVNNSTAIGAGAVVNSSNTVVLGTDQDVVRIPGNLSISGNASAQKVTAAQMVVTGGSLKMTVLASPTNTGNQPVCLNGSNFIAACPSSFNIASDNSLKERQPQIEAQSAQINEQKTQIVTLIEQSKQQQAQIEALKQTVCAMNPAAGICGK